MLACRYLRPLMVVLLLAGCQQAGFAPAPFRIVVADQEYEVTRYAFLSRGFTEYAPVEVRRASRMGLGLQERMLAEQVLADYCAWFRFEVATPAATYWTEGGDWHFAQGCMRAV